MEWYFCNSFAAHVRSRRAQNFREKTRIKFDENYLRKKKRKEWMEF